MAPHQLVFGQRGYSRPRSHLRLCSLAWGSLVQELKLSGDPCPRSLVTVVVTVPEVCEVEMANRWLASV